MPNTYFSKLPNVIYDDKVVKDVTRRAKIVDQSNNSPSSYYPFQINNYIRPDVLSEYYYEAPELDWLIYMTNEVIDPYYGWYLSVDEFEAMIIDKYGTRETAIKKIKFYRNNWYDDDGQITTDFYNTNLINDHKKYYTPVYGIRGEILSYKRKEDYTVTNTNRIIQFTVSSTTTNGFSVGELVDIKVDGGDTVVANGELVMVNTSVMRVHSVTGNTTANSTLLRNVVGTTTGANATVNASSIYFENFSNSEAVFWSAISFYDWENECNEAKKNIRVIGDSIHELIIDEFEQKIQVDMDPETGLVEG